jgi:hypothetical protein
MMRYRPPDRTVRRPCALRKLVHQIAQRHRYSATLKMTAIGRALDLIEVFRQMAAPFVTLQAVLCCARSGYPTY